MNKKLACMFLFITTVNYNTCYSDEDLFGKGYKINDPDAGEATLYYKVPQNNKCNIVVHEYFDVPDSQTIRIKYDSLGQNEPAKKREFQFVPYKLHEDPHKDDKIGMIKRGNKFYFAYYRPLNNFNSAIWYIKQQQNGTNMLLQHYIEDIK